MSHPKAMRALQQPDGTATRGVARRLGPGARGFTLVEVLVALAAMALLAVMAWRGVDAMGRAQSTTRERSDDALTLQAGLSQWRADLDAMVQLPPVGGADFDGRVLRLTRQVHVAGEGDGPAIPMSESAQSAVLAGAMPASALEVVAWGARLIDGQRHWLRWKSPPLRTREQLQLAWQMAAQWGENPTEELRRREVAIAAIDEWQVFYFRQDSWSSPLSSAAGTGAPTGGPAAQVPLPDGVRLALVLSAGQALSGRLQLDWVRAGFGSGRP